MSDVFTQCNEHSSNMANGKVPFRHDGFETRIATIVNYRSVAENVAMNYSSNPKDVVNQWLNSSDHKANIEGESYNYSAISAVSSSNGAWYYTQIFIGR